METAMLQPHQTSHIHGAYLDPENYGAARYVDWVHSLTRTSIRKSLFTREYKRLLKYLEVPDPGSKGLVCPEFVAVCDLFKNGIENKATPGDGPPNGEPRTGDSRIVFLAGYPCAQDLAKVASIYEIHPDFLEAHLSFVYDDETSCNLHPSIHTLPSRHEDILQISIQSIGATDSSGQSWSRTRSEFETEHRKYIHGLRMGNGWKPFHSIVRNLEVHDQFRFSLEQFVTVQIKMSPGARCGWTSKKIEVQAHGWSHISSQMSADRSHTVYMWSDGGLDLSSPDCVEGAWTGFHHSHFRPVSIPRCGPLVSCQTEHCQGPLADDVERTDLDTHQSLPLLRSAYSRLPCADICFEHPLEALEILFRYFCVAETQYLDSIETVLHENLEDPEAGGAHCKRSDTDIMELLLHLQQRLRSRRPHIRNVVNFLHCHSGDRGIRPNPRLSMVLPSLSQDLEYLLVSNEELLSRCDQEAGMITSRATFLDAQRGIELSKGSHKFALLAAIYVPLSFTCSIFGMNFVDVGDISMGFRVWALVTVPICLLSTTILLWDEKYMARSWRRVWSIWKPS